MNVLLNPYQNILRQLIIIAVIIIMRTMTTKIYIKSKKVTIFKIEDTFGQLLGLFQIGIQLLMIVMLNVRRNLLNYLEQFIIQNIRCDQFQIKFIKFIYYILINLKTTTLIYFIIINVILFLLFLFIFNCQFNIFILHLMLYLYFLPLYQALLLLSPFLHYIYQNYYYTFYIPNQIYMGASQLKQYNLKQPLITLSGGYSFLKFSKGIHPNTKNKITIFIIKKPHRLLNPSVQSQFPSFSETKQQDQYTLAISQKDIDPLILVSYQKNMVQLKIVLKIMIQKPAQLGRYFITKGKFKLWCQQKRGLQSLSPQQVKQNRSSQNSKVFCSGISFLNFLAYCLEKSKTGVFEPKNKQEYLKNIQDLSIRIQRTDFWHILDVKMKQIIKKMIEIDSKDRIDYNELIKCQYLCDPIIETYYDLCQMYQYGIQKQTKFLNCLQKNLYLFDTFIIKKYIIPILVEYLQIGSISHLVILCLVQALNRSNIISTQYFETYILNNLIKLLKNSPTVNTVHNILLKSQHWSNYMTSKQFQQYFISLLLKSYQSKNSNLLSISILKTEFFLDRLTQITYKNQIQNQLLALISGASQQNIKILALKCIYTLLKTKKFTNVLKIHKNLMNIQTHNSKIKLHILKIYSILIQQFHPSQLLVNFSLCLGKQLNTTSSRPQFQYCYQLYQRILERVYDWYIQSAGSRKSLSNLDIFDLKNEENFILKKQQEHFTEMDEEQKPMQFTYFKQFHNNKKYEQTTSGICIGKIGQDEEYKVSEDFGKVEEEQGENVEQNGGNQNQSQNQNQQQYQQQQSNT